MELAPTDLAPPSGEIAEGRVSLFAADHSHDWLVLHVKSRQEKALSLDLSSRGIEHFLPQTKEVRLHAGRKVTVESPLFPGYVFLRGPLEDAYQADRTRRVAQIIRVADQSGLNSELANLHLALSKGIPLSRHDWLKSGVRVEVIEGPLLGLQGMVEDPRSFDCVVLQVYILGRAVSVEMDPRCVAAVD